MGPSSRSISRRQPLGRVVYVENSPTGASGKRDVFFELGDHLGSTSMVIDQGTGELV